jgi:hypothetical protein
LPKDTKKPRFFPGLIVFDLFSLLTGTNRMQPD